MLWPISVLLTIVTTYAWLVRHVNILSGDLVNLRTLRCCLNKQPWLQVKALSNVSHKLYFVFSEIPGKWHSLTQKMQGNILIAVMYFVKAVWSHLQADLYAAFDSQQVARGQKKMLDEEAQCSYLLLCGKPWLSQLSTVTCRKPWLFMPEVSALVNWKRTNNILFPETSSSIIDGTTMKTREKGTDTF